MTIPLAYANLRGQKPASGRRMRLALINPQHRSIGSRAPVKLLPPLGLLMNTPAMVMIGGPLVDAGHQIRLVNVGMQPMTVPDIIADLQQDLPEALLIGHSGSTSVHSNLLSLCAAVKTNWPEMTIIYGGVFPSHHWAEILREAPEIDIILRGEGEATARALITALAERRPLVSVPGIAFRWSDEPFATPFAFEHEQRARRAALAHGGNAFAR